jgi:hypothetical protein
MRNGSGAGGGERDVRLAALEERVARLEAAAGAGAASAGELAAAAAGGPDADVFWALHGLQARVGPPGAVLFTGSVTLPGGEHVEWQEGRPAGELLGDDWSQAAASLTALAHPVRLLLVREVLHGATTVAQLSEHPGLGTSGQLYHHLRQLVSAGWLHSSARGRYDVPADRVVPLLAVLAATRR